MQVYTYSEARQRLSSVLDEAEASGNVLIVRRDGRVFRLAPESPAASPLNVPSINASITTAEIVSLIRKERGRTTASSRFLKGRSAALRRRGGAAARDC